MRVRARYSGAVGAVAKLSRGWVGVQPDAGGDAFNARPNALERLESAPGGGGAVLTAAERAEGEARRVAARPPVELTRAHAGEVVEHGGGRFYVCREDETPARVAAAHGVATHALVLENRPLWGAALTSNARLELGTALRLPPKVSAARARAARAATRGDRAADGDGG